VESSLGTRYFSVAHSPKSMSLQRSEQNGRYAFSGRQATGWPQVGQATVVVVSVMKKGKGGWRRLFLACSG
jgi:hypothetical protein